MTGSLIKNAVPGLYALGFWNTQQSGVAGNSRTGCTAVYVGSQSKYPNVYYPGTPHQCLYCIDYYVMGSQAKLLQMTAQQGTPIGVFLDPKLKVLCLYPCIYLVGFLGKYQSQQRSHILFR
jgi:hypothetical protein